MTPKEARRPGSSHLAEILEPYVPELGPDPKQRDFCVIFRCSRGDVCGCLSSENRSM